MQRIKKACNRLKMISGEFIMKSAHYSFSYAIYSTAWWLGWYIPSLRSLCMWGFKHKDKWIKSYIYANFGEIIKTYREDKGDRKLRLSEAEYPIWVFWYQGFEYAPPLVKACIENLKRKNVHVNIIDKGNLGNFVQIPSYIDEKVREGVISLTHYSDIVRVSLLAEYGGIWIDSTCFVSREVPSEVKNMAFYSSKTINERPLPLWSNSRWCSWSMGSTYKAYPLFVFLKEMLYHYWAEEDSLIIDYLFLDALIEIGFKENPEIYEDMNSLPENNLQRNVLWGLMNCRFDENEYRKLTSDTWLFKLSYKTSLKEETENGRYTYYKKLLNQELN